MPKVITETEIRVFVATPSDVLAERDRLPRVIEELNAKSGAAQQAGVRLVLKRWETDSTPDVGRPQQVIFDQLLPNEWDIFIGILWLRFGTETGLIAPATSKPFLSGTEEEFKTAYRLRQSRGDGFPRVMFYRCTRPPADITRLDLNQYARVLTFLDDFLPSGAHPGLVWMFNQTDDFERLIRQHLSKTILEYALNERSLAATPKHPHIMKGREYTVFISHSTADLFIARSISKEIKEVGANTWLDDRNLESGGILTNQVLDGIRNSNEAVVLLSADSVKSQWVNGEIGAILALDKKVTPLLINVPYDSSALLKDRVAVHVNDIDRYLGELKTRMV